MILIQFKYFIIIVELIDNILHKKGVTDTIVNSCSDSFL